MGLLLEGLLRGTLLNPEASAEMLSILRNQRLNGKMPFYLHSRGIPVAHKTGEEHCILWIFLRVSFFRYPLISFYMISAKVNTVKAPYICLFFIC